MSCPRWIPVFVFITARWLPQSRWAAMGNAVLLFCDRTKLERETVAPKLLVR